MDAQGGIYIGYKGKWEKTHIQPGPDRKKMY